MSETAAPTAMQLFAAEFIRELKPLLAELQIGPNPNELLTKYQVAKEFKIAPKRVQALLDSGAIKYAKDTNLISRWEVERYVSGRKR